MLTRVLGAAVALAAIWAGPAHAVPAFCTGATITAGNGDFVPGSFLVNIGPGTSTGNCVLASDKYFGGFSVAGAITGGGTAGWLFTSSSGPADVTIGFQGLVGPSSVGSIGYEVEINPLNSNGALISAHEMDFTLNTLSDAGSAVLTSTVVPGPASFSGGDLANAFQCTRSAAQTCPQFGFFDPLTDHLTVSETISTNAFANVTALTNTEFQAVPEPGTLGLLGIMLVVLSLLSRVLVDRSRNAG